MNRTEPKLTPLYDLELLRDVGPFKKGERVRGLCESTSDFSKFKRWFLERHDNDSLVAVEFGEESAIALYRRTFKLVTIERS